MPHDRDVCNDNNWYPHHFNWVNNSGKPVTINKHKNDPWPFVPDPPITVLVGHPEHCELKPDLPRGTYYYDVNCEKGTPKTIIIS